MRKITCKDFLDTMSEYLDGELQAELRVQLEAHLAKCPNCWVVFDETQRTVRIVQSVECHPLPRDVRKRLQNVLERNWQSD